MQSMEAAAKRIARRSVAARGSRFCGNVAHITFNAWHYSDANLWASLVSQILEGLQNHVSPAPSPDEQVAALDTRLDSVRLEVQSAEDHKRLADEALAVARQNLEEARAARDQQELRLRDLKASDYLTLLDLVPRCVPISRRRSPRSALRRRSTASRI